MSQDEFEGHEGCGWCLPTHLAAPFAPIQPRMPFSIPVAMGQITLGQGTRESRRLWLQGGCQLPQVHFRNSAPLAPDPASPH
ncbi:hypothetical protein O181_066732 [Austropuccinia psidii MF-1]|uniref:Uncharacterized protein n=1 Tax=Austropuccinia psidii MF-1 TaxID=1389203 RepID=A0A9Q3EW00_9BASI|nr:hypothetical protein [Austropuccinia psidii MF-1]